MPVPIPEQLKNLARPRINRAPSPVLALSLPWLLVMLGSLTPALPVIASAPIMPPLGFLFLLGWLHLRPGIMPVWAGLPLGLLDDLFSGQPLGSAMMLWSLATIGMDFVETRFPWRGFMQNWLVASTVIAGYLLMAAWFAAVHRQPGLLLAMLPQIALSILIYPIAVQVVGLIDRLRLIPVRVV
ncbi:rod shape-determining protein MreD [Novosphingobium sp. APW14]|jgi:rod shape-determining protein MreD|uniref:rod shape-determining protein MreD n=1 Tax=Novosphingobium sp. APW14 TaxID=3077237 RepID=UPI0028DE8E38|nr:rod shape-determining protein MreD [Novosphingobium sp. APW14]MDT9012153.1 rod shape-determining protein MreD [Novosphingobium sp. APW14]